MTGAPEAGRLGFRTMLAYRKSAQNLVALASIQVGNALLPLVAYPHLLGVVGPEAFAPVAVAESIMLLGLAFVNYSFEVDGVTRVSSRQVQDDPAALSRAYFETLFLRLALLAVGIGLVLLLSPVIGGRSVRFLLAWSLFPLGYILGSTWFYQALERNSVPATAVVLSRVLCVGLLWRYVRSAEDALLIPLIIGSTYAAAGAVLAVHAISSLRLTPTRVTWDRALAILVHGKEVFVGNLSVALYRDSNVILLRLFSSSTAVSLYAVAEKMVKVFQAGARPLNQFYFPRVVRSLEQFTGPSREAFGAVLHHTRIQIVLLASGIALLVTAAILLGDRFRSHVSGNVVEVGTLVGIMGLSVFFGVANYMFGIVGLNFLNRRRFLAKAILGTGLATVLVSCGLISAFNAFGAAIAFNFGEMMLFIIVAREYLRGRAAQ